MYTYVHLFLVDPSSSWALPICPWIPVSPFASWHTSPPRAAVASRCWYGPLHTHKDTDANRYSNHAIPPTVLWNSLDALKTSFCCHHPPRDTQTDSQVTLPTQLAHLAYLQNKSHPHNCTCPGCYLCPLVWFYLLELKPSYTHSYWIEIPSYRKELERTSTRRQTELISMANNLLTCKSPYFSSYSFVFSFLFLTKSPRFIPLSFSLPLVPRLNIL